MGWDPSVCEVGARSCEVALYHTTLADDTLFESRIRWFFIPADEMQSPWYTILWIRSSIMIRTLRLVYICCFNLFISLIRVPYLSVCSYRRSEIRKLSTEAPLVDCVTWNHRVSRFPVETSMNAMRARYVVIEFLVLSTVTDYVICNALLRTGMNSNFRWMSCCVP